MPIEHLAKADFPASESLAEAKHARFMKFVWIPPGSFVMGDDHEYPWGGPRHPVKITRGFYMGVVPVTQAQWLAVMGSNPSHFRGADRPVECVSWDNCQVFCHRLGELTGKPIRLPTEAEWEYACRAGTTTEYYTGNGDDALRRAGWTWLDREEETHSVGQKDPNAWGLYDMHGNVWEWCQDWFDDYAGAGEEIDSEGPKYGASRVLRGGSWSSDLGIFRAAARLHNEPANRNDNIGVRVCFRLHGRKSRLDSYPER